MTCFTLNLHCYQEKDQDAKLKRLTQHLSTLKAEVIAFQEVGQHYLAPVAPIPDAGVKDVIRQDNMALRIRHMLAEQGLYYHLSWAFESRGFDVWEQGLAVLTFDAPVLVESVLLTRRTGHWSSRHALRVRCEALGLWVVNVHLGWWEPRAGECFSEQFTRLMQSIDMQELHVLLGDFNAPDTREQEAYACVRASGWQDTWELAGRPEPRFTVEKATHGWTGLSEKLRLDYVFVNHPYTVSDYQVLFRGEEAVSDHYAVFVAWEL